jgi:hypothetical protein
MPRPVVFGLRSSDFYFPSSEVEQDVQIMHVHDNKEGARKSKKDVDQSKSQIYLIQGLNKKDHKKISFLFFLLFSFVILDDN